MGHQWDEETAYKMYLEGRNYAEIAKAMNLSRGFVRAYAIEHWSALPDKQKNPQKTTAICARPCFYLDGYGICNFFLDTGIRRPCACGPDCTVRIPEKRPRVPPPQLPGSDADLQPKKGRPVKWDVALGRYMRRQGATWSQIADAVGRTTKQVARYGRNHGWEKGSKNK